MALRSHSQHIEDGINKDSALFGSREAAKEYFLSLTEGWNPIHPKPIEQTYNGVRVVRDDLIEGTKARAADHLLSKIKTERMVYVQPRTGLAGVSLLDAAKHHNRKVTLFMPSSKKISLHQACCIERGADVIFKRIAAMPNLNKIARDWAEENDAYFIPLGLRHELATAAIVHTASQIPEPDEVYVAISTGVLTRSLQIAWPNAKFTVVAVARNLKEGEAGPSKIISHPYEFTKSEDHDKLPPFETIETYDGKVWRYIPKDTGRNILMWNVGRNPVLNDQSIYSMVNSYREWEKKIDA
jgi:hypothetical protein